LASQAYSEFLQPYNPQAYQDIFQRAAIEPAQQALQRNIIPTIKESFLGLDESGSSALNQALAQSATDLSTALGTQYLNFYNQQQANKLGALGGLQGALGQRTFEPRLSQTQGLIGPLISALGQVGAAAIL